MFIRIEHGATFVGLNPFLLPYINQPKKDPIFYLVNHMTIILKQQLQYVNFDYYLW